MRRRRIRHAFTLLELLLASSLAATMMLIVWSLFSVFTKLNEKGTDQATELQLARSLMSQLRTDIQHMVKTNSGAAFTSTSPPNEAAAPANAGTPALPSEPWFVGSDVSFQFLARSSRRPPQPANSPMPTRSPVASTFTTGTTEMPEPPLVYDIVSYEWQIHSAKVAWPPVDSTLDAPAVSETLPGDEMDVLPPVGLTRRAASWVFNQPTLIQASAGPEFRLRPDQRRNQSSPAAEPAASITADSAPSEVDRIPEITNLRFRYFDGTAWRNHWDSTALGQIPTAIEVAFEVQPDWHAATNDHLAKNQPSTTRDSHRPEPHTPADSPVNSTDNSGEAGMEYRLVVAVERSAADQPKGNVP